MAFIQDMYTYSLISDTLTDFRTDQKCDVLSGYNSTGNPAQIPGGILNAMIKIFLSEKIGIGVTQTGEIYVEVMGDARDDVVSILYNSRENKIQACRFNIQNQNDKRPLVTSGVNKIPYYIAIPFIIHQRIQDRFRELEDAWNEIVDEAVNGIMPKIAKTDAAGYLIDSIVNGEGDYPISLGNIENLALIPGEVYDYTSDLLKGKNNSFVLARAVARPVNVDPFASDDSKSYQAQMKQMKDETWPLVKDYYESLSDEEKALVPDEDRLGIYIPTPLFKNIVRIIADGLKNHEMDSQNVLLKGPPGVGKSVMAVAIAYVFSMPYRFTQSYKTADASEYIGTTVADNGVLKTNIETQFAQTVMRGGVHMDDDNNYAAEGEGTVKNSILIAPYTLKLADGTMAKRHPFSIFMMSANPDMKGARPINEAYKDRYCIIVDMKKLSENEMVRMVKERSRYTDEQMILRMLEAWDKINDDISATGESADMLTPRTLVNWAKQTRIVGNPLEACHYNILGALCATEEYRENILNNIIRPLFGRR
ncbi:MAG TPA: hypothetical protein DEB10_12910 [Ruminococcaceae bacterium]|jgi:hypothetical protein|nr:hypothetical protein [Oscillospiraceae bacterium]